MSFISSDSSSLDSSRSSSSRYSSGRSSVSDASSFDNVVFALMASQASKDNVGVGLSKSFHGLNYTSLKVESLGVKRLAQPSFYFGRSLMRSTRSLS